MIVCRWASFRRNDGLSQPVANAATLAPSCAHTSGVRRLSEERLLVLGGCDTSRRYRGDSRTGLGASAETFAVVYGVADQSTDFRENTAAKKRATKQAES